MNAHVRVQLEIIVHRAVHPVWASALRKHAIREELLAHVGAVFEEELERLDDEQAALCQTRLRFGVVEEVRSELQSSIPFLERCFLRSEKEILMSRWLWCVAVLALLTGPAFILPAIAKFRHDGDLPQFPFALGVLITLAALGMIGYGIKVRLSRST